MEYIQYEINKHKTKLMSLINNLINTQLISEEIFINNEIKKESECLISLLNAKQNIVMNQINLNNNINFNPLMLQPNPLLINVPAININQMQPKFIQNNFKNNDEEIIDVIFKKDTASKVTLLHCNAQEKISETIKRYREKSNDYNENRFIVNGRDLNPSLTLAEFGIVHGQEIRVDTLGILKGAKFCYQ